MLANASKRLKKEAAAEAVWAPPPDPRDHDPLHGVAFASPAAHSHAQYLGMTWKDFAGTLHTPSGATGHTKADVVAISRER